jgi:hypothetical protein
VTDYPGQARITARLNNRREALRAELEARPALLELSTAIRETFGIQGYYFRFGSEVHALNCTADDLIPGIVPCEPYTVKKRGRKL